MRRRFFSLRKKLKNAYHKILEVWSPKVPKHLGIFCLTLDKSKDKLCFRDLKPYLQQNATSKFDEEENTEDGNDNKVMQLSSFSLTHLDVLDHTKDFILNNHLP